MASFDIRSLGPDQTVEATSLLAASFTAEETTRALLRMDKPSVIKAFGEYQEMDLRRDLVSGAPALAAYEGDELLGVALGKRSDVTVDDADAGVSSGRRRRTMLRLFLGSRPSGWGIWFAYKPPKDLPEPYVTLESLAVADGAHGRGVGRALLDAFFDAAACDIEGMRGVYLLTAGARPRRMYERNGFSLVEEKRAAGLTIAHMFRECDGR